MKRPRFRTISIRRQERDVRQRVIRLDFDRSLPYVGTGWIVIPLVGVAWLVLYRRPDPAYCR